MLPLPLPLQMSFELAARVQFEKRRQPCQRYQLTGQEYIYNYLYRLLYGRSRNPSAAICKSQSPDVLTGLSIMP